MAEVKKTVTGGVCPARMRGSLRFPLDCLPHVADRSLSVALILAVDYRRIELAACGHCRSLFVPEEDNEVMK